MKVALRSSLFKLTAQVFCRRKGVFQNTKEEEGGGGGGCCGQKGREEEETRHHSPEEDFKGLAGHIHVRLFSRSLLHLAEILSNPPLLINTCASHTSSVRT